MITAGVPVGGLVTVAQIVATNTLTFHNGQNGLAIAVALKINFITSFSKVSPIDIYASTAELSASFIR